jgi:hypothetical protein
MIVQLILEEDYKKSSIKFTQYSEVRIDYIESVFGNKLLKYMKIKT